MNLLKQFAPHLTRSLSRHQPGDEPAPSAITATPAHEVTESGEGWEVTVHLPGVTREGLELTAENDQVVIQGRRAWEKPAGWTPVWQESATAPYRLVLEHEAAIDLEKIRAELKDGVLQVSLPKAEALKPRKIAVN